MGDIFAFCVEPPGSKAIRVDLDVLFLALEIVLDRVGLTRKLIRK